MPVFLREGKSVLVIHIPKTGGTALEHAIEDIGWQKVFSINGIKAEALGFLKATPQHYHGALIDLTMRPEAFDRIVMVCRDPVARMKSEYYWQKKRGAAHDAPAAWVARMIALQRADPYAFDNHLRPQVEFLPATGAVEVFRLEDDGIAAATAVVAALGADPAPAPRLPWQRQAPRRDAKISTYDPDIDAAFQALAPQIRDFYAEDVARFGY